MGAGAAIQPAGRSAERTLLLFARLVESIRRVEKDYPVWDCGLSGMCRLVLPDIDEPGPPAPDEPSVGPAPGDLSSQLTVLDVSRQLGLVPLHEYRRQRRAIMHRLRLSRFGQAPVLAHVLDVGDAVADGYDDGIRVLARITDRVHRSWAVF